MGVMKDQLNPQLAMNKPKWISDIYLHRFNLGEEPPSISGVKVSFACALMRTHSPRIVGCFDEGTCEVTWVSLCIGWMVLLGVKAAYEMMKFQLLISFHWQFPALTLGVKAAQPMQLNLQDKFLDSQCLHRLGGLLQLKVVSGMKQVSFIDIIS